MVRSLARDGVRVDVADNYQPATALWRGSRHISDRHLLPEDEAAALNALLELGARQGGVLIPTNDVYLYLVSRHHDELSGVFTVAAPPWNILEPLVNKVGAADVARRAGLETPEYFWPQDAAELEATIAKLDFANKAYVLKIRLYDNGAADAETLRRVALGGVDAGALRANCEDVRERTGEYPLIEEVVAGGPDRCIGVTMVVGTDHKPVFSYCVRRMQLQLYAQGSFKHPYALGANAYCESVEDREAQDLAERFVREARYVGAVTVELKRDSRDDRLKFIKADTRVVRATRLSTALGMDVPVASFDVYGGANRARDYPVEYKAGVGWIWLEAYLYSIWKNRRALSVGAELWRLVRRLPRVGAWAYFDWRDPLPSVLLVCTVLRRLKMLENRSERTAVPGGETERAVSG